jgi:hypothetical protein
MGMLSSLNALVRCYFVVQETPKPSTTLGCAMNVLAEASDTKHFQKVEFAWHLDAPL